MIWVSKVYYFLRYDPKEVIKVYVGVNNQDIGKPRILEKTKHDIIEVIKHENWDGTGYTYPDLALIKLAKRVTFKKDLHYQKSTIAPLCLSNENIKADVYDSEAFVAGNYMIHLYSLSQNTVLVTSVVTRPTAVCMIRNRSTIASRNSGPINGGFSCYSG